MKHLTYIIVFLHVNSLTFKCEKITENQIKLDFFDLFCIYIFPIYVNQYKQKLNILNFFTYNILVSNFSLF